jgi:hypothetical protein
MALKISCRMAENMNEEAASTIVSTMGALGGGVADGLVFLGGSGQSVSKALLPGTPAVQRTALIRESTEICRDPGGYTPVLKQICHGGAENRYCHMEGSSGMLTVS